MADQLSTQITNLTQAIKALDLHVTAVANGQGGAAPDVSTPSGIVLPANSGAAAQQQLAQQAATQVPGSVGANASYPIGSAGSSQQEEAASINALTWESLGNMGGPLGAFQQRQYVASRYGRSLSGAGNALSSGAADNDLASGGDGTGGMNPFQSAVNSTQARLGAAASWAGNTLSNNAGKAALIGGGLTAAYGLGSNWADAGVDLGYGAHEGILADLTGKTGDAAAAAAQGAALDAERRGLQLPSGAGFGAGLTESQASQAVSAVGDLGFSDQNGLAGLASGNNTRIASKLVAPLMQQGVSAQGAADWSEALRNANDTIPSLTASLTGMSQAAQAANVTTDQYNTSLLEFAQNQVANGGTIGQATQTGMDFTGATGMLPSVLSQLQNNPVYQGLMMGQNGVLPSDIGNLTPGAQLQGVQSLLKLYGGGLGGLDQNKYENVGGVKVVSSYGNAAEAAQIASMTGMSQGEITRLMRETQSGNFSTMVDALNKVGSSGAEGGMGTGLWSILNQSNQWKTLSAGDKAKADQAWNRGIAPDLSKILTGPDANKELRQIDSTDDIRKRANLLQKDLLGNQKNNPNNKIEGAVNVKLELTGYAKKLFKGTGTGSVKIAQNNATGPTSNTILNTVQGDAMASNPGVERFGSGL